MTVRMLLSYNHPETRVVHVHTSTKAYRQTETCDTTWSIEITCYPPDETKRCATLYARNTHERSLRPPLPTTPNG